MTRNGGDWPSVRLGDVVVAKYGKALPEAKRRGGGVPVFGSNGIVGWHDDALTGGPTIVVGRKRSSGAVNFSPVPCWPIDTTYCIDEPGPYSIRFLDQLLRTLGLTELDRSTAIPGLNRDQLYDIDVPLPDIQEQDWIVAQVGLVEGKGVSAGRHLTAVTRASERFRQSVLAAACSGRLTFDWRSENPRPRVAEGPELSAQAKANATGSANTNDLVDLPETWAWWTVEGITECVIDYRGRTPPHEPSGLIPHVRTSQLRNGRIDWSTDRFVTPEVYDAYMTRGIPKRGDVLFTMEAPMGEVGVVDRDERFSIAQRILLLRPGAGLSGEFMGLALRSHPVRHAIEHRATGSGVLGVSYKRFRSVVLPKPPLDEQVEIVRRAQELLRLADRVEARILPAARRVERTSQAVLAKALRGELVGSENRAL